MLAGLPADLPLVVVDNSDGSDGLADVVRARPRGRYLEGGGVDFARDLTGLKEPIQPAPPYDR